MAQRLVACQAAPRADQQPEPVIETITHLAGGHRRHPRGRQLDGQWNPVEASADFDHRVRLIRCGHREARGHTLGAFDEQTDCGRVDSPAEVQRGHRAHLLVGDSKSFAAGGQDSHGRGMREDGLDEVGGGVENVLAVVEYQQPDPALQRSGHRLTHGLARLLSDAQHRRHRVGHRRRIGDRSQCEKPNAVGELIGQLRGDFGCQAGLANPAHTGQRHKPMSVDRRLHLVEFGLTSDEAAGGRPQIPGLVSSARNEGKSVRRPGARS